MISSRGLAVTGSTEAVCLIVLVQGVQVQCVGEGPVVHVTPTHIDYGTIPVLTDVSKMVRLSNESLIPAQFSCSMVRFTWLSALSSAELFVFSVYSCHWY